jgi:hypothetical protein
MTIDAGELGLALLRYCERYAVPPERIIEILNDQKVVPMIRGKATEFRGFLALISVLPPTEWSIEKLNLNAQPGSGDEDISVTHRRTGEILKAECKNAVRGSMCSGSRARICNVPHFRVKCHRSRSNIKLAGSSNDRYSVDTFDLILTNVSNALFEGGTVGAELELLYDENVLSLVRAHYHVSDDKELKKAAYEDWRFVFPSTIAQDGYVPRTPVVQLEEDPNWRPLSLLPEVLLDVVKERSRRGGRRGRNK